MAYDECIDSPQGCEGEVFERPSMSGSGMAFPRCDKHYAEYAERMAEVKERIRKRYPDTPPDDFDPTYAGETW